MNLSVITPTGDRPEAFALCERWMSRQTLQPIQWIVLDDGTIPTKCNLKQEYIYCPEFLGQESLVRKIHYAIEQNIIKGDAIVFFEDDDWYAPNYLELINARLHERDLVGEGKALYYNVEERWWAPHSNMKHASLCQTALRRSLFPILLDQCKKDTNAFIDCRFWADPRVVSKKVFDPIDNKPSCVGIKSMPGRRGYGVGHIINRVGKHNRPTNPDPTLAKLTELIGRDAEVYISYYRKPAMAPPTTSTVNHISKSPTGAAHGPNWMKWIGHLKDKPDIIGMELGTFKGESAEWMLDNIFTHDDAMYICVDTFGGSPEHKLKKIDVSDIEEIARNRLAHYKNAHISKSESAKFLRSYPLFIDFIYVDADHSARGVLRDAVLAFEVLKIGGRMVFDDYDWNDMPEKIDTPQWGIDAFLKIYAKQIRVVARGWQVCVEKISE